MPCARGLSAIAARLSIHERPSLEEWLISHREEFITFMLEEVAQIALISGYAQEDVDRWLYHKEQRFIY